MPSYSGWTIVVRSCRKPLSGEVQVVTIETDFVDNRCTNQV